LHCLEPSHSLEKIPIFSFGDCIHVNARSCEDCASVPLFPNRGKARKFRVVRLNNPDSGRSAFSRCGHFVAVSYCWPRQQKVGRYIVREENGRSRPSRAPDEVLDRAVAFAAQNGIRLIWIDQVSGRPHIGALAPSQAGQTDG
jgi:hypothetical protein